MWSSRQELAGCPGRSNDLARPSEGEREVVGVHVFPALLPFSPSFVCPDKEQHLLSGGADDYTRPHDFTSKKGESENLLCVCVYDSVQGPAFLKSKEGAISKCDREGRSSETMGISNKRRKKVILVLQNVTPRVCVH